MKRYRPVIFISFYMIILIIIAAQLWGANGFLHPAIENINLYVRGLRNTHAPLFHQSYDNYLQLLPGILLIGLKLGGVKGHTATAFMTATLLYKEYGFKGIWVSLVAYASAIVTGMTRILNNRHWIIDVIVGAALGILLTEMAYRLVKTIFKDRELINTDYNH